MTPRHPLVGGLVRFGILSVLVATASAQQVYRPGSGVTDPTLVKQARPEYTPEARQAGIEGIVELEAIIMPDGSVSNIQVTKSLDTAHGLDAQAVAAARQWRFRPGELDGKPVPVLVTLILDFRLGNRPGPGEVVRPVYRPQSGVTEPVLVRQVPPKYTPEARQAGIEGVVELEGVVTPSGTLTAVRVKKSLDAVHGLDAQALEAARQWLFRPGELDGKPVPVLVTLVVEFRSGGEGRRQAAPRQAQDPDDEFIRGTYLESARGVVPPAVERQVAPKYTSEAMRAKIQGIVIVEAVVDTEGRVDRVRIKESLDDEYGLDEQALDAVRQWRFEPGTFEGKPVPVLVSLTLEFRLHEPAPMPLPLPLMLAR